MRSARRAPATLYLAILTLALASGCSSRSEVPVVEPDSTLSYPAKKPDGITASITLCRDVSKKTGKRLGTGRVFTLAKGARVHAFVDLENPYALGQRLLKFHLVWSTADGNVFYQKQIAFDPSDEDTMLKSSISIRPSRRDPGDYTFRVYLFRELIAEKNFRLRTEAEAEMEKAARKAARRADRSAASSEDQHEARSSE